MNESSTAGIEPIGIVGIGLLGSAIAERLLTHHQRVYGYDLDQDRARQFQMSGGERCHGIGDVIASCNPVVLCLPSSDVVGDLIEEHLGDFRANQTVIDTTTGDPEQSVTTGETLAEIGVQYIEANVAGSSDQMREGQATLLLGGHESAIAAVNPTLAILADQRFELGPVGMASRMKLVHNLVLGLHRAVLAEGLNFAQAVGIEPRDALQVLRQTPAASNVMDGKGDRMVRGDFEPQARLSQHLKDVLLILAESERVGCQTPLSAVHRQLLDIAVQLDLGALDNSAIVKVFAAPKESNE